MNVKGCRNVIFYKIFDVVLGVLLERFGNSLGERDKMRILMSNREEGMYGFKRYLEIWIRRFWLLIGWGGIENEINLGEN